MPKKYKRVKVNTEVELDLITGLIVSERFNKELMPILNPRLIETPFARTVARWCVDYYKRYKKNPGPAIQEIYKSRSGNGLDEDQAELIGKFLSNLSKRYENLEQFNEQFLLDQSEEFLASNKIGKLKADIDTELMKGNINEAEHLIANHTRTKRPSTSTIDVLTDKQAIMSAIYEEEDVLFNFSGALGDMVGPICRGDFFSFMAPGKRGKSWWLLYSGIAAVLRGYKILFVNLEMQRNQVLRRIYQLILGETKNQKKIELPYFDDEGYIQMRNVKKKGLKAKTALKKIEGLKSMTKNGGFKLITAPSKSLSVHDIKIEIENLAHYEGFYPHGVIVDYADILGTEPGDERLDHRNRIDGTWSALRGLAQEINGFVGTVTHSNKSTYSKNVSEEDTTEDIRKMNHVTHMIALNQTADDKKSRVMRVSMLANRNEEYHTEDELIALYNYAIGKACIDSRWKKDVNY